MKRKTHVEWYEDKIVISYDVVSRFITTRADIIIPNDCGLIGMSMRFTYKELMDETWRYMTDNSGMVRHSDALWKTFQTKRMEFHAHVFQVLQDIAKEMLKL